MTAVRESSRDRETKPDKEFRTERGRDSTVWKNIQEDQLNGAYMYRLS